jgi:hypothetical protein
MVRRGVRTAPRTGMACRPAAAAGHCLRAVRLAGAVDDDGHEKVGGIVLEQRELATPNPNV